MQALNKIWALPEKSAHKTIDNPEEYLFNIVSSCLLKEVRYYDTDDDRRNLIIQSLVTVAEGPDPEFILKLALYTRHQLYIRTTSNFITAFCCMYPKTTKFVKKYLSAIVILPTDLLEICQYCQALNLQAQQKEQAQQEQQQKDVRKHLKFPKCLQKAVKDKFPEFNIYQFGKYCSEQNRKKMLDKFLSVKDKPKYEEKIKLKKEQKQKKLAEKYVKQSGIMVDEKNEAQEKKQIQKKAVSKYVKKNVAMAKHKMGRFNMNIQPEQKKTIFDVDFISIKDIVKFCHIKKPQFLVQSILGKRYPETELDFDQLFAEDKKRFKLKFDQVKATKRMKIPVPITWETQLSAKGNKPEVWTELIMNNTLPYMAMMRNLRNILKSGVQDVVHQKIIEKIQNSELIAKAKMFPFQYFSALVEIDNLTKMQAEKDFKKKDKMKTEKNTKEEQKLSQEKENKKKIVSQVIEQFGNLYKEAINNAISKAVDLNLDAVKGHTLVFADVSGSMHQPISGGKRYGSIINCQDVAILLGLMIRKKCEQCTFYLFSSPPYGKDQNGPLHQKVNLYDGNNYLENLKKCESENKLGGGNTGFPGEVIQECLKNNIMVDNIVILSDLMISVNYNQGADFDAGSTNNHKITEVLNNYREKMNPNLKIFSVDLRGYSQVLNLADEFGEKNYIKIFGMSDQVLRFISLRENSQMQEIGNFSEAFLAQKASKKQEQQENQEQQGQQQQLQGQQEEEKNNIF